MILYALVCGSGHRFETWFRDSAAFEDQSGRKLVECPTCQSSSVTKTIMAPAILNTRSTAVLSKTTRPADIGPETNGAATASGALLDEGRLATRALVRAVREKIMAEGHDVGRRFPDEARRMHDGDIPHRQIHGQASAEEVAGLLDDGIMVLPLPVIPDELN